MTTTRSAECKTKETRQLLQDVRAELAAVVSTASIMVGGPVPNITGLIARIDKLLERN